MIEFYTSLLAEDNQVPSLFNQLNFETVLMEGFSKRIKKFAHHAGAPPKSVIWAGRAALEVSRSTEIGHVCISLSLLAKHYNESLSVVREALLESGVVVFSELRKEIDKPLVVDRDNRLYLARYFYYEYQFANSLVNQIKRHIGDFSIKHVNLYISNEHSSNVSALDTLRYKIIRYFDQDRLGLGTNKNLVDWQIIAVIIAQTQRVTIISGGPGTGKTTTLVKILACLLDTQPDLRIALAAPTRKAAQRIKEAIHKFSINMPNWLVKRFPTTSYTLHRLLGGTPAKGFRYHRNNTLPYEVIIVDEASMIDIELAYHLLDALESDTRLILLGDKDQLGPINAGAVFSELSARLSFSTSTLENIAQVLKIDKKLLSEALTKTYNMSTVVTNEVNSSYKSNKDIFTSPLLDCVVWLKHNYRFSLNSPIGRLSFAIRLGKSHKALEILLSESDETAILNEDDEDTLSLSTTEHLIQCFSYYMRCLRQELLLAGSNTIPLFDSLNRFRILCATHTGFRGSENINSLISLHLKRAMYNDIQKKNAVYTDWFSGRLIMVKHNSYALGLLSGDIGVALPDSKNIFRVWFRRSNNTVFAVLPEMLPLHEDAFALTVHKSQGSEFDNVVFILPTKFNRILTRELIYTAVTRARKRIEIVSKRCVLTQAISTCTMRNSGLASHINEASKKHS